MNAARLLIPVLRAGREGGFGHLAGTIEQELARGVGGFILFGGAALEVRELTSQLHERAPHPLLVGSDLERGAGQQFRGATPLPPLAAQGSQGDLGTVRRAGELSAREARALGVNWLFAPVADVDLEPGNPIIGTRAFGTNPEEVARMVAAWVEGCAQGGALSCGKHFPGHGRTVGDSHIERPVVETDRASLEADLTPFRAAIEAGADSFMSAHVAYPALDASREPATLSRPILHQLLRGEMGFGGMVVTDALIMEGFAGGLEEPAAAVRALAAGCDVLLYPEDIPGVVAAIEGAVRSGELSPERLRDALGRVSAAARRVSGGPGGGWGREDDRRWALHTAVRTLRASRGEPRLPNGPVKLIEIDDDLGGPYPPYPRDAFAAALKRSGVELSGGGAPLLAVYCDIRAWKGRPGLSPEARQRVESELARTPGAPVILFAHPRLASELADARHLLAAWGGEGLMQEAAAAWLTGERGGLADASGGLDR